MNSKTLGQIAYEEWDAIVNPAGGIPWERVGMQLGWENIARAVVIESERRFEESIRPENLPPLSPAAKAVLDDIGERPFAELRELRVATESLQSENQRLREALKELVAENQEANRELMTPAYRKQYGDVEPSTDALDTAVEALAHPSQGKPAKEEAK